MKRIGLREQPKRARPQLRGFGYADVSVPDDEMYFPDAEDDEVWAETDDEADVADQGQSRGGLARGVGTDGGEGGGSGSESGRRGSRSFRQSMKRAFRGMLMTRRESSPGSGSKDSRRSTGRFEGRPRSVSMDGDGGHAEAGDLGLARRREDALEVAVGFALPGEDLGEDVGEGELVEGELVEGDVVKGRVKGVAVMEESVGLGRADVVVGV